MSTTLKLRGGSTAEHSTFTGEEREVTVDTQKNTVVVHDGSTVGGHPVANQADITSAKARANHTGTQPHTTITGLGTAATSDVTTSETDTTAGRLLKVGDFGLGTHAPLWPHTTSLDDVTMPSGVYRVGDNPDRPNIAFGTLVFIKDAGGATQTYYATSYNNTPTVATFQRRWTSGTGTWSEWQRFYHRGNILGTVSQSGGVPTGAIIERGSNANGEFVRYADGTQICTTSPLSSSIEEVTGNVFASNLLTFTCPIDFVNSNYKVFVNMDTTTANVWGSSRASSSSSIQARIFRSTSAESLFSASCCAIGRWH